MSILAKDFDQIIGGMDMVDCIGVENGMCFGLIGSDEGCLRDDELVSGGGLLSLKSALEAKGCSFAKMTAGLELVSDLSIEYGLEDEVARKGSICDVDEGARAKFANVADPGCDGHLAQLFCG